MTITTWALISLVIMLAAIIMCATGFGFALVTSSLLLIFLDPKTVIVYNLFLGIIICIPILWQSRRFARPKRLVWLGTASILGVPAGIYILSKVVTPTLKLLIAALVVIFALLLAAGYSYRFKKENLGSAIIGFMGGTLMSSTGLGGPPVVLFLINQGYDKDGFRANMTAYLTLSGSLALIALGISGAVSAGTLLPALTFLPALALGFFLGIRVQPRLDTALFSRIVVAIVTITGLVAIATTIPSLL